MRIFFPKHISTDVKCTTDNIVRTLFTHFLKENFFFTKCSAAHLECNSDRSVVKYEARVPEKICRPSKFFTTNLSGQLDCLFDNTDWRPFSRYPKELTASCLYSKKLPHVLRVFDNNGRCFCTQSSEETRFLSRNLTFTKTGICIFDNTLTLADKFWTK